VTLEGKKPALVARDKIISPTRLGQRQQKIIGRVRGSFDGGMEPIFSASSLSWLTSRPAL
jgi:hypothetical protein